MYAYHDVMPITYHTFDTSNHRLKISAIFDKNEPWDLLCYSHSDYVGDNEKRKNVSGFILSVCEVPITLVTIAQHSFMCSIIHQTNFKMTGQDMVSNSFEDILPCLEHVQDIPS